MKAKQTQFFTGECCVWLLMLKIISLYVHAVFMKNSVVRINEYKNINPILNAIFGLHKMILIFLK